MAINELRTQKQFLQGSSDLSIHRRSNGTLELLPDNLIENANLIEIGDDLEPVAFNLAWNIQRVIGYHVNVSRPGSPKRASLARQTTALIPPSEGAYTMSEPWVAGIRGAPTSEIKPPTPEFEAVLNANKGWEGGTYGWAEGWSGPFGPTTTSGVRFYTLANGEIPKFPYRGAPPGATHWDIYSTRKNGSAATLVRIRSIPIDQIRSEEVPVKGPWVARGRPPAHNRSGVGSPPKPKNKDCKQVPSGFNLPAGKWKAAVQVEIGGGLSLLSPWGKAEKADPSRHRVKVAGPAPASAEYSADAAYADPREIRPSGKRSDQEYLGQEVDFEESRLVSLINAERERRGLPLLVLNAALNRAAENGTEPDAEGYRGRTRFAQTGGGAKQVYGYLRADSDALDGDYEAVGVARHHNEYGWYWRLYFGDDPELPDPDRALSCESFIVEHVEEDGTLYSKEVQHADVLLGWDLVVNNNMRWSYSGSFGSAVQHASNEWNALGVVNVSSGGGEIAITDGSLGGPMARTYSDGRMIFDSGVMSGATQNARRACACHEFGHGLGFDHTDNASVMRTPIYVNRTNNYDSPTSYDRSEYRSVYGSSSGGGSGSEDPPGGHGNEVRRPETKDETNEQEFHYEWRDLPYKKNTSLRLRKPAFLRGKRWRGARYTYFLLHESLSGVQTTYRVIKPGSRRGTGAYFGANRIEVCCELPDEATGNKKAPTFALLAEEVPTEDTTIIEPPDASSPPDEPTRSGQEVPPAGRYIATVSGVLEGGGLTEQSEPGRDANQNPYQDITSLQMVKVNLPSTLNLLRNAEFTRVNSAGLLEDITAFNTGGTQPGYFRAEGGVLTLGVNAPTTAAPRMEFRPVPYDPTKPLTIAGTVGANFVTTGTVRVSLRQLDETGATISSTTLADLAAAAELPFTQTYAAGALNAATASWQVILRLEGATVNAEGYFKHLRALPLPSDVRYAPEEGGFDATPDEPVPGTSFLRAGVPPESETTVQESEAPYSVVDFESGAWPAGWVEVTGGATHAIEAAAKIHGTLGQRTQDSGSTNALYHRYLDAGDGVSLGNRQLRRVVQLPTRGYIATDPILGANGGVLAVWRIYHNGAMTLVYYNGSGYVETGTGGVSAGDILDRELVVSDAGTRTASVSGAVGKNGAQRSIIASVSGLDYRNLSASRAVAGVTTASDRLAKWNLHLDQIVVTRQGDVLDREKPKAPAGYVPPPPDRPTLNGSPRGFDANDEKIGQLYALVTPGSATPDNPAITPLLDEPIPVRPGLSYTLAAFCRFVSFTSEASPGLRVWLEAEDKSLEPFVAASIPFSGTRGWQETDDFATLTVPAGYDTARFELVLYDGVYVLQELLFSMGSLVTLPERDAKRTYGRAATGYGEWIFDIKPEAYEEGLTPGVFVSEFGVKTAPDETGTLATAFTTGQDLVTWIPYASVEDTPLRYVRMALTFTKGTGDGPKASSLYVRTWSPIGVLLREDGTHFPGVAYVGNLLSPSSYPEVDVRRTGGRLSLVPISDSVERIEDQAIPVACCTEEARQEIQYLSSIGPLTAEIPTVGGTVAGQALRVVFDSRIKLEPKPIPPRIADGRRIMYFAGSAEYAEVLEASPQQAPMKIADLSGTLQLAPAAEPA